MQEWNPVSVFVIFHCDIYFLYGFEFLDSQSFGFFLVFGDMVGICCSFMCGDFLDLMMLRGFSFCSIL